MAILRDTYGNMIGRSEAGRFRDPYGNLVYSLVEGGMNGD